MARKRYSLKEAARRGRELYEKTLRTQVETEANIGKLIAIDLESGDYEIDDDIIRAVDRLRERRPDAETWVERIGYDAVYGIGGSATRTAK